MLRRLPVCLKDPLNDAFPAPLKLVFLKLPRMDFLLVIFFMLPSDPSDAVVAPASCCRLEL